MTLRGIATEFGLKGSAALIDPISCAPVALLRSPSAAAKTSIGFIAVGADPTFIHESFFEYANQSVLHCAWAKLFVQEQIAKGKKHPTAVRALAFNPESLRGRLATHHVRLLARPCRV